MDQAFELHGEHRRGNARPLRRPRGRPRRGHLRRDSSAGRRLIAAGGQLLRILAEEGDALGARGDSGVDGQVWSFSGRPFVVLRGGTAEFRLDRTLAAAARRTPDATPSPRGEDWVAFNPREIDQFAEDRLRSWFGAAYRRAIASSARS